MPNTDNLLHLKVQYHYEGGDFHDSETESRTRGMVVLPEDYDDRTLAMIASVADWSSNRYAGQCVIDKVLDSDGHVLTRDFSEALYTALSNANIHGSIVDDVDTPVGYPNAPALGDHCGMILALDNGTTFKVTIERHGR